MRRLMLAALTVLSWLCGPLHVLDKWLAGVIDAWPEKLFEDVLPVLALTVVVNYYHCYV